MSGLLIGDGTGRGHIAGVTADNQLYVQSESQSVQHHASVNHGGSYQIVSGERVVNPAAAYGILAIRNDGTEPFAITYIRVGYNSVEVAQVKLELNLGGTWVAGSATASPVQLNQSFSTPLDFTTHYNAIPTGSSNIDTKWMGAGPQENTWNKEGTIIVTTGKIFSIKVTPTTAGATFHARISGFIVRTP